MVKPRAKDGTKNDPRCWWCHMEISVEAPYRGTDDSLPPMVGVVICTPACPERPDGAKVYSHPDWRTNK